MILLFLTSGLFLGWSLGANDASHVFGSAVGSKMVSFRKAAIIASVFVILGAVLQGSGTSHTLAKLGTVNALGGSFTVALAAAITIYVMTKFALPVSSTQAIVGAIIGWNFFTGNNTDTKSLSQIVIAWVTGPVIGSVFAIGLYIVLKFIKKYARIHLIRFESFIRTGLIIVGAFCAYSLGANNIANVMGVFIPAFSLQSINLGVITLNSDQQLFLIGGFAISAGIITYSRKVMETIGNNIIELSSEAALVVVLAQALVLFIFSSSWLSSQFVSIGLPPIPMIPVSSSQLMVGCIIGIGIYKGSRNINFRMVGEIAIGWISTPVASALLAYFSLFFMKNIFNMDVGTRTVAGISKIQKPVVLPGAMDISEVFRYILLSIFISGVIITLIYFLYDRKRRIGIQKSEEKFWQNMK